MRLTWTFVPAAVAIIGPESPLTSRTMGVFRGRPSHSDYGPVGACIRRNPHPSQTKLTAPLKIQSSDSALGLPHAVAGASCRMRTRSLLVGIQ